MFGVCVPSGVGWERGSESSGETRETPFSRTTPRSAFLHLVRRSTDAYGCCRSSRMHVCATTITTTIVITISVGSAHGINHSQACTQGSEVGSVGSKLPPPTFFRTDLRFKPPSFERRLKVKSFFFFFFFIIILERKKFVLQIIYCTAVHSYQKFKLYLHA